LYSVFIKQCRHPLRSTPFPYTTLFRSRGRARVERNLGPARRIENVLEGLLVEQGERVDFEPHEPPEPTLDGRVDLRDLTSFTIEDRKSTRLNSSHSQISYAVFCLKKKN